MNDDQYQISIATSCQKITEIKSVVVKQHDAIPTYYLAIKIYYNHEHASKIYRHPLTNGKCVRYYIPTDH